MKLKGFVHHGIDVTANLDRWQSSLASAATRRRSLLEVTDAANLASASDGEADHFWAQLYANELNDRVLLNAEPSDTPRELARRLPGAITAHDSLVTPGETKVAAIAHLNSGRELDWDQPLGEQNVEDGDLLGVLVSHPTFIHSDLAALPNPEAVFSSMRSANEQPPALPATPSTRDFDLFAERDEPVGDPPPQPIWGALLYTEEDEEVAAYVRKHFAALNEASGPTLRIFVIEQPPDQWRSASRYWEKRLADEEFGAWTTIGWLKTKPYDPSKAYELARRLGIYQDQLPCLVLFERPTDETKLVFPIDSPSARFFRGLFAAIQRALEANQFADLEAVKAKYREIVESLESLTAEGANGRDLAYHFHGKTVFINRPGGRWELSNFLSDGEG